MSISLSLQALACFLLCSLFCIFNVQGPLEPTLENAHSAEWHAVAHQTYIAINLQDSSRRAEGGRPKSFDTLGYIHSTSILLIPTFRITSQLADSYFPAKPFLNLEILSSRNHPPTLI